MKTDLPDLDILDSSAIGQLAETAESEEAALERIYSALTEATLADKLRIAAIAILNITECRCAAEPANVEKALFRKVSSESLISLAIAILEKIQSGEDDEFAPPDCEFDD